MDRRIFGIENEYAVAYLFDGRPAVPVDEIARLMYELEFGDDRHDTYLRNGSRFYLDIGFHPEYASGECDSVPQLIAHDKAGERFVEALALKAQEHLTSAGKPGSAYVFKNNADSAGNSYGTHENYLVQRSTPFEALTAALLPFLVTRHLIAGSGTVIADDNGARYCFAQRPRFMAEPVAAGTTRHRGIISTKDEPHADSSKYRRLHLLVGDANMAEPTMLLKVGATDLVLRMIEDGAELPELAPAYPIEALKTTNLDLTGQATVVLEDGRETTGLAVQQAYAAAASRYVERRGIAGDPVVARVLELWRNTLRAIETQNFALIDRDIDWAIKLRLLRDYGERRGLPFSSPRVAQLALGYHDVRRSRGLYYRMLDRGLVNRVVGDADIAAALVLPPQTTRAKLRGDLVRRGQETGSSVSVDWVALTVHGATTRTVLCPNPLNAQDSRVTALLRSM